MRPNMVRVRDLLRALGWSWSVEERPRSAGFFLVSFWGSSLYLDL